MNAKKPWGALVAIIVIAMVAVAIVRPRGHITVYNLDKNFIFSQGLDLQGGLHLKYRLDLAGVAEPDRPEAIKGAKDVMEKRINPLGVSEPVVQTSRVGPDTALIIELPGQKDVARAIETIGQTAQLTFQERDETGSSATGFRPTGLTGADLRPNGAVAGQNHTTSAPIISLSFTGQGSEKFAAITTRNVGKPLAIFLDNEPLQIATVREPISGGQAQISGQFTLTQVRDTVRLLNAGALPVPLTLIEQRAIGASLGTESVQRGLVAGLIGLAAVALFMVGYYRALGGVAVAALALYTVLSLAIFKAVPITLTLSGITGFILSIGMAVDANILIFERYKEERRSGSPIEAAIAHGFNRAWPSIRDSNASSIITALILYNFASSSLIRGFSLTLIIGILVSLFTAVTVSRTLLYLALGSEVAIPAPASTISRSARRGKW